MGLGPPVCVGCMTIGILSDSRGWYCPSCGDTNLGSGLWEHDMQTQETMEGNHRFWRAMVDGKAMLEREGLLAPDQEPG